MSQSRNLDNIVPLILNTFLAGVGATSKWWHYFIIICLTSTTYFQLLTFKLMKSYRDIPTLSFPLMVAFNHNFVTFIAYHNKALIFRMKSIQREGFYNYKYHNFSNCKEVTAGERVKKFCYRYVSVLVITYGIILIGPLITTLTSSNVEPGSVKSFIVPSIYPWEFNLPVYLVTYLFHLLGIGVLSIPVVGNITFVAYFYIEVRVQRHLLVDALSRLKDNNNEIAEVRNDESDYRHLVDCVKHHEKLLEFIRNFTTLYGHILTANILNISIIITFVVYDLASARSDSMNALQMIPYLIFFLSELILYCEIGQKLLEMINFILGSVTYRMTTSRY